VLDNELGYRVDLIKLGIDLRQLIFNADMAMSKVQRSESGRDKDIAYDGLLKDLRAVYQEGTGRDDWVTWDDSKGSYRGNFFTFVVKCSRIICRYKGESAIGKAITRRDKQSRRDKSG